MQIIVQDRQSGKTDDLVKQSNSIGGSYIVCHSKQEAIRISTRAFEMGYTINYPITFPEFLNKNYDSTSISCFLIDNAEVLLQELCRIPIETITMSNE